DPAWQLLAAWHHSESDPRRWQALTREVEARFPERWFLWAHRARVHLEHGEGKAARDLFAEIDGLDPPGRALAELEDLGRRLDELRE
ncbi:MAG: hypothetical protein Q8R28_16245, partial [Dehalococcoidia bacterium]|nr:hypothetical protein [Dehalococcoidia bacterium]